MPLYGICCCIGSGKDSILHTPHSGIAFSAAHEHVWLTLHSVAFPGWDDAVLNMTLGEKSILTITGYVFYFARLDWTGVRSIHSCKPLSMRRLCFAGYFDFSTSFATICGTRKFVTRDTNTSALRPLVGFAEIMHMATGMSMPLFQPESAAHTLSGAGRHFKSNRRSMATFHRALDRR